MKAVGNCSYNQLVEKIISCKQSDNSELAGEGEHHTALLSLLFCDCTSKPDLLDPLINLTEEGELKSEPTHGTHVP